MHFDAKIIARKDKSNDGRKKGAGFGGWGKGNDCAPKLSLRPKPVRHNFIDCANNIVPDCLRALYGIPELDHRTKLNVGPPVFQSLPFTMSIEWSDDPWISILTHSS